MAPVLLCNKLLLLFVSTDGGGWQLAAGGFCIIDDYWSFDDCKKAVDEYRAEHGITADLVRIDGLSCYWRK